MRFKTVIESRVPKHTKRNQLVIALMLVIEVVLNTMLPFLFGYYFCSTQSLFFLLGFIILIMFNVRFDYNDRQIRVKIIRGL